MKDLVSIIMPTYNSATYIEAAIGSVLEQDYTNWELLIVDDCSTDNTKQVIEPFLSDERIHYFKSKERAGAAVCRNHALRKAKGRWIAFLDSDDLWLPGKLSRQTEFMESNHYAFSYTRYAEIDGRGNRTGTTVTGPAKITRTDFYNYCWPGCLTVMYDADKIGLIQVADIRKNNDYAMWLKICRKADCYLLNEELALYRRGRTGSISNHRIATMIRWHYLLFRKAERQCVLVALFNTARNLIFGFYKKIHYVKKEFQTEK